MLPFKPMSPILVNEIPRGEEWGHQLKWDGYRIIASVDHGKVKLYSKNMLISNGKYPGLVEALSELKATILLDGEAVILDPVTNRPSFAMMQHRGEHDQVQYIMFDLLQEGERDLRQLPFQERHERLHELAGGWGEPLFLTDLFEDGEALWRWVQANRWEGVVSKRLSSTYRHGKKHWDWFKRKTTLEMEVEIVGLLMKEGRISSLVMRRDGVYVGRNSLGLNQMLKTQLDRLPAEKSREDYFPVLPEGLHGAQVRWLNKPFMAVVTGLEMTKAGTLRHPKINGIRLNSGE